MENQSEKVSIFKRIKEKIAGMPKAYWMIAGIVVVIFVVVGLVFGVQNKSFNLKKESFKIIDVKNKTSGNYIDLNETFLIETRRGSLEEVQKHIYVEPPVNYEIKRVSVNQYELIAKDIPSDTLVNVSYVDNKVVENKWAFQSTKDFKVTSIYPTNGASDVSVNTGVEITFSYPNISEINNYVEIVPAVEGSFTCSGRTCIFKAKDRFEYGTIYTIKVKPGVYSGDYHLEEEVQSSFSTLKADSSSGSVAFNSVFKGYNSITLDKISTFRPTDNPMFRTGYDSDEIVRVEVFKIKDAENFLKCLNQLEYTSTSLGEVAIHSVDDNGLYALDKTLEKGYYIFQGYDNVGILSFTMPVQIHELSTYVLNTQSDFLVWVGSDNSLLKDIPVTYEGKTIKTDKEGIAYFKDFNTADGDMKYIAVGKDNPLYVGVSASSRNQYADAYIYTDRPLYKNTDEIKIWGFIPFKYYAEWEDFSKDQFVLSFDDNNIPIKINDDGTFITNYSLNNYKDGTYYFELKYKNVVIDSRYVQVLQYEKDNYLFTIKKGSSYVRAGDQYHFEVAVKHISGIMVPNKEIKATVGKVEYTAITNSEGIASFDIATKRQGDSNYYHLESVHVTSSLSEYAQKGYYFTFFVIDSYVDVDSFKYDTKNHSFSASIYNLDDKMKKIEGADGLYSGTVRIEINERVGHRSVSGSYYNDYTKKNYNTYSWTYETNTIERKTVTVKNGVIKHKTDYSFKESTDDTSYSYYFNIFITDRFGNDYYYDTYFTALENNDYRREGYFGDAGIFYDGDASLFEYYFVPEKVSTYSYKKYHVGDSIPRELNHYSGSKEDDGNTLLLIKYKNHILDREVISYKDGLSIRFDDKDRPGIDTTSAYFKNGVFHRMPIQYIDYDENDSKLDIAVNTNAKNYQPKDRVTAKIKVTQNGKGKKAKILVSVVDEAVFNNTDDHTDILENLYLNETYRGYLYSSYRNYMLHTVGGGGGAAAGEERSDFGDTLYFEMLETDKDGNANVNFTLNDSITSFRITVHAVTENVDAGDTHVIIKSNLPVSIIYTEPRGLKILDEVVLNASSIGSSKENVHYTFTIDGVDKQVTLDGKIGEQVFASFGNLPVGEYMVHISATSGGYTDKVKYPIHVSTTQTEVAIKNTFNIHNNKEIKPTRNPVILELFRNSFKSYEDFLEIIRNTNEERMDVKFSYMKALNYENQYVEEKNVVSLDNIDVFKGKDGWKYLPAEDVSYELTAILAYYDKSLSFNKDLYYNMIRSSDLNVQMNGYVVLAAMKEPVLDDIRAFYGVFDKLSLNQRKELVLASLFLGDYNTIRSYLSTFSDGLEVYLSTFVDKTRAEELIRSLHKDNVTNRYLYFAIVSFFDNNNVELESVEKVKVSYGKESKEVEVNSLGKKQLRVYQEDLKDIKLKSDYNDIFVTYYYEGAMGEIDDALKEANINARLSKSEALLGDQIQLKIDISNIPVHTRMKIYLPNGLRLGSGFSSNSASIVINRIDYIVVSVYDHNQSTIEIPLYASSKGTYVIEPIVVKNEDHYQISNPLNIKIQ